MIKKIVSSLVVFVLLLTIITVVKNEEYTSVTMSGLNNNWKVEDASLLLSDDSQILDAGTLTYTGDSDLEIDFIEVNVINKDTNKEVFFFNDYYIDYARVMKNGEKNYIGGNSLNYLADEKMIGNDSFKLAAKVTYSLKDCNEMKTEIIDLY